MPVMTIVKGILRLGIALTFAGHGLLALFVKEEWLAYLEIVGMSKPTARTIMPFIGVLDLLVALIILARPHRYVVIWAFVWAFATALIRPVAGESILAFIERGANWAAPLALYFLMMNEENTYNKETPSNGKASRPS